MRESPRRLRRLATRPLLLKRGAPSTALNGPTLDGGLHLMRRVRVIRRFLMILLWTLPAMPVQALCLILPGRPKVAFARLYWALFTRLLGLQVRVIGELASHAAGRPVVFVSNHSSWVDVPVLGGVLDGCFVAKGEVARWPLMSTIARLGRSVFVSRQRGATVRELAAMRVRLRAATT